MNFNSFIDCSRLSKRVNLPNLTGIDRVIQSYIDWLSQRENDCYFINHSPTQVNLNTQQYTESPYRNKIQKASDAWRKIPKYRKSKNLRKNLTAQRLTLEDLSYDELNNLTTCAFPNRYKKEKGLTHKLSQKKGVYFSLCHQTLINKSYLDYLSNFRNIKKIFFFHDVIPLDFPEYCRDLEFAKHKLRIIHLFQHADHIIVNSQYTFERLTAWQKKLSLTAKPISVIHIGVHSNYLDYQPVKNEHLYFVILGTIEARKNHQLLIEIWKSFSQKLPPEKIPHLKIIGKRGWKIDTLAHTLDNLSDLKPFIHESNSVKDEQLWPILKGARALLFPSHVEGWGMPLVEALSVKVPAICSDIPSLREAGKNLPTYIDTQNTELWAETILKFSTIDSPLRKKQQDLISNFAPPTWQNHFAEVEKIITSLF